MLADLGGPFALTVALLVHHCVQYCRLGMKSGRSVIARHAAALLQRATLPFN
jgi:hypothetical protein